MASHNVTDRRLRALQSGINKSHGPNGVLAELWGKMLLNLNIIGSKYGRLMQDYLLDERHGIPNNRKDQTSTRGNLTKELMRNQMTWKVFIKGLRFLQIVRADFTITAYHADGSTSKHSIPVELGTRREVKEFNDFINRDDDDESVNAKTYTERQASDMNSLIK